VLSYPELQLLETARACCPSTVPYRPGFLSFRELPAVLEALGRLSTPPDLILCDGNGRAHPRRFGLACHLGVSIDRPSIGVAKSRHIGRADTPGLARGRWTPLIDGDEVVGAALRTRAGVKPVFVSVGHRVSLETAIEIVLMSSHHRVPEPLRCADQLARRG
jgi:deoxyribonuclease V